MSSRGILVQSLRRLKAALVRAFEESARHDGALTLPIGRVLALGPDQRFHHPARVALEWLDESPGAESTPVQAASAGWSHGPKIRGREEVEPIHFPAVVRHRFRDARVCAASSSILMADRLIVERVVGIDPSRCSYAAGHLLAHGRRTAIVAQRPEQKLDAGAFLGGNGAFNYYHWIIELLSRLEFIEDDGRPLLVSDDVARIPTFQETLTLAAGARAVVFLKQDATYRVADLIYVQSPSICPFNLRRDEQFEVRDFQLRPSSIEFLRGRLLGPSLLRHRTSTRRRLFFARKPVRRGYNQDEIFAIFERRGFEKVYMEDLSLKEQIEAVQGADMLAGPTGAAWTNLLFVERGTRCICWMAEEQRGFAGYSNLAHAVGAELRYVTYAAGVTDSERLYFIDYRLDPGAVERELDELA
ncbi:MAG TPA: glycosyltransferase family 61 protein [Caldimonas sp.]|nr:glycosyltransferase family 61 protein [Caldimonas sp.]